jgi:hypothetical protein
MNIKRIRELIYMLFNIVIGMLIVALMYKLYEGNLRIKNICIKDVIERYKISCIYTIIFYIIVMMALLSYNKITIDVKLTFIIICYLIYLITNILNYKSDASGILEELSRSLEITIFTMNVIIIVIKYVMWS